MRPLTQSQPDRVGKALIVDDEPIVRRYISAVLRMSGFEVLEAAGAAQALVAFQASGSDVDLVITDIQMPEMNGCDLAQMLLATHPNLPILLISGSHAASPASLPFLQKPFTSASLLGALQAMLGARRIEAPGRQPSR